MTGYLQRELTVSFDLLIGKFEHGDDALSQYQDLVAKLHDAVSAWGFSDIPWMLQDKVDDEHKQLCLKVVGFFVIAPPLHSVCDALSKSLK